MNSRSYISKRFEFKYMMSRKEAVEVEKYLTSYVGMTPDENSKNGSYTVNSLYFDTPQMSDYRDKDASLLIRKKLRARMYEDCWHDSLQKVWLEVKHKKNMNISKRRVEISGDVWRSFMKNHNTRTLQTESDDPKKQTDLAYFAQTHSTEHYRPIAVVRYLRKAYLANFTSPVRITFDYDVQTCRAENAHAARNLIPVSHNKVIMEVKFNNKLPWWFSRLISEFDLRRTDFSKYRNSLAVIRGYQNIPISK